MSPDPVDLLVTTRRSLHAIAEHVLAPARHRATGRIGLQVTPGGFGTPPFPSAHGDRVVRMDGCELVVTDDRGTRRRAASTLRVAASLAEIEAGAPVEVFTPTTPLAIDEPLTMDPASTARLARWFELLDSALRRFRQDHADREPSDIVLWPEHFDLALSLDEVNYGGSPGDDGHDLPYLYVGPWDAAAHEGPFWNEPFGGSTSTPLTDVADALAFFRAGREAAGG